MPNKGIIMLNGRQYGDTGTNYNVVKCTKQEYDAMTPEQKNNGCLYIVVDSAGNSVNYLSAQVAGAKTDDTMTNLLNPTLATTTINGVTFTNNGDGTYTLNGTNNKPWSQTPLVSQITLPKGKYHYCGTPAGGSGATYKSGVYINASVYYDDFGNGVDFELDEESTFIIRVVIYNETSLSDVVFKPMLTTDLSASYDDFVAYTGGTGRLNSDVAQHEKEISRINADLSEGWVLLGQTNSSSETTISFESIADYKNVILTLWNVAPIEANSRLLGSTIIDKNLIGRMGVSFYDSPNSYGEALLNTLSNTSATIGLRQTGYNSLWCRLYASK